MPISTSGLTLDAKTLPILPLQLAQGFSSFWDLSPPTRGVRFIGDLAWVLSPVLCVCVACLCVSGTRVWVTRSPDVTQGMPAVEGDDCRGQVGLRTQDWGSPWGWKQGGGPLCWGGGELWPLPPALFTPCFSQLRATACQWGSWGTGQPSVRGLCTVHSGMSGA